MPNLEPNFIAKIKKEKRHCWWCDPVLVNTCRFLLPLTETYQPYGRLDLLHDIVLFQCWYGSEHVHTLAPLAFAIEICWNSKLALIVAMKHIEHETIFCA